MTQLSATRQRSTSRTHLNAPLKSMDLPDRGFISPETRRQFRLLAVGLMLATALLFPFLVWTPSPGTPSARHQSQAGSLTVQAESQPVADQLQPLDLIPPTTVVFDEPLQHPQTSFEQLDETSQDSEPVISQTPATPSLRPAVTKAAASQSSATASDPIVENLLTEYVRDWPGLGNGPKDGDGEESPAYVFGSMDSYQRLLQERGVVIAFNRQTEVRFQLGTTLAPRQWKESYVKSWADLPRYSKRVSRLPTTHPLVSSLRARFLSEHPDWAAGDTMLMVAIPEVVDAAILQAQQAACKQQRIRPNSRVVTIGDLTVEAGEIRYVVRAVKDFSVGTGVAAR